MISKEKIRESIKQKLHNISDEEVIQNSDNIFLQIKEKLHQFESWFVYLTIGKETQTEKIINFLRERGKIVLVPKILANNEMIAIEYNPDSILEKGVYGIMEVKNGKEFLGEIDVAIVPGLAFTRDGKRLGRGKGYYDKYLGKNKKAYKIGICMPEQVVENLPVNEHDVVMDEVLF